jgi:hypothetical protein
MEKGPQPITNAHALFFSAIIWLTTTTKKGKQQKNLTGERQPIVQERRDLEKGAYVSRNGSLKRNVEPRPRFLPGISSYFPAPFAREIAV